jgi:cell division protease FtsH
VAIDDLVELTNGLSCAQIENLANEAMLNALRHNRKKMIYEDVDLVMNKMLVGWQPNEHQYSANIIDHIAIHEMGHVVLGVLSKHHAKVSKVSLNLFSPRSPGYTVFETSTSSIFTRESLFEHLMILLGGRIAEEEFYGISVTTGAINDFEEALKLAERMVVYYGMGRNVIYPHNSDKYKQLIDDEVMRMINTAYSIASTIIRENRAFIGEMAELLKEKKVIRAQELYERIETKYSGLIRSTRM